MNIFVTPKISLDKNSSIIYSLEQNWYKYLKKLGFNLILIPSSTVLKNYFLKYKPSGLIISGGGDIYKIKKTKTNLLRDISEKRILNFFQKKKLPILAVCRGFQLICSQNRIKLFKIKKHVRSEHLIFLKKNYFNLNYSKIRTNSFHNYGVKKLNEKFDIIGYHLDGTIEIAKKKKAKLYLMMFHPERYNFDQTKIDKLIKNIFK